MFDFLATLLAWFYSIWPSYGGAIVLLTLTIMLILTPLTLKGTRSMMMMQALQPEMKKIQQRYKDDRQKLNEELLKFYKENNINPVGGCLPLLVQMPVFLVLYRVLDGLTRHAPYGYLRQVVSPGEKIGGFDPSYISHDSDLYKALHGSKDMVSWGIDLSQSATQALRDSFGKSIPFLILIAGVVATSYIQQKQVSGRTPAAQQQMNPQQQMLLKIMPVFFAFISLNLPAALVVYFLVSNMYRVAQQDFISRRIYKPALAEGGVLEASAREVPAEKEPAATEARGGFFSRLLGEATPRLSEKSRTGNGSSGPSGTKGSSRPATKGNGGRTTPSKSTSRPSPGRTTPAGGGPQPRARKKKKRK